MKVNIALFFLVFPVFCNSQKLVLEEVFKSTSNYFISEKPINLPYGIPLSAYKVGDRARYGYSNPTEWGYYMQAIIALYERGLINKDQAASLLSTSLSTLASLQGDTSQNYKGFFYPYYKVTSSLGNDITPYHDANHEIPSGDNGLLYNSLLIIEGWGEKTGLNNIEQLARQIRSKMDFSIYLMVLSGKLYLAHLINADTGQLSQSKWDVYSDEGGLICITAYISNSVTFQQFQQLISFQLREPRTWNGITVQEACWFNAMFTWVVRTLAGWEVEKEFAQDSFFQAVKAHLKYGEMLGIDYAGLSDAMSQTYLGNPLVGRYTPPNLNNNSGSEAPVHILPHAFFIPFCIPEYLDAETKSKLEFTIDRLLKDQAQYYHTDGAYPFGLEVLASPKFDDTQYSGADDGRNIFETLSQSYILLSIFEYLQKSDGKLKFSDFIRNVEGYSSKAKDIKIFLYGTIPNPTILGNVQTPSGTGISGVTITFSNGIENTTTDNDGFYAKPVIFGWSGEVTPTQDKYTFTPSSLSYSNITLDQTHQNYIRNESPSPPSPDNGGGGGGGCGATGVEFVVLFFALLLAKLFLRR